LGVQVSQRRLIDNSFITSHIRKQFFPGDFQLTETDTLELINWIYSGFIQGKVS